MIMTYDKKTRKDTFNIYIYIYWYKDGQRNIISLYRKYLAKDMAMTTKIKKTFSLSIEFC